MQQKSQKHFVRMFDGIQTVGSKPGYDCWCEGCGKDSSLFFAAIVASTSVFLASKPGTFHPNQIGQQHK